MDRRGGGTAPVADAAGPAPPIWPRPRWPTPARSPAAGRARRSREAARRTRRENLAGAQHAAATPGPGFDPAPTRSASGRCSPATSPSAGWDRPLAAGAGVRRVAGAGRAPTSPRTARRSRCTRASCKIAAESTAWATQLRLLAGDAAGPAGRRARPGRRHQAAHHRPDRAELEARRPQRPRGPRPARHVRLSVRRDRRRVADRPLAASVVGARGFPRRSGPYAVHGRISPRRGRFCRPDRLDWTATTGVGGARLRRPSSAPLSCLESLECGIRPARRERRRPRRRQERYVPVASPARTAPKPAKKSGYTGGSITVLEGLEAVRKRPGMYIGSTSERGLHHLVWEVVDNSVDEALAGHADKIEVTLLADGGVRVTDNGRGMPVDMHPQQKRPTVEVILTVLHAGGKFDSDSYAVSGGLHGVGVSVVNALSHRLEVEIDRDGYRWTQPYVDQKPAEPLKKGEPTKRTGTTVTFWADPTIFETTTYSLRDDQPPAAGDGVPEQGPDHRAARRAGREGRRRGRRRGRAQGEQGRRRRSPTTTPAASPTSSGTSTAPRSRSTRTRSTSRPRTPPTSSRSRSRCSGTPPTPRASTPSPTRSTPSRAARTKRASGPR